MLVIFAFLFFAAVGCGVAMLVLHRGDGGIGSPASQKLFLFEFVALVMPYLVLVAFGACALVVAGIAGGISAFLFSFAIAALLVTPMVCGFHLSITFVRGGITALRQVASPWWWGAIVGAAIPVVGLLALALKAVFGDFPIEPPSDDQPFGPTRVGQLSLGLIAAPLLIPLSHLLWERFAGSRSDKSQERTNDR